MKCTKCNQMIPDESIFCLYCGTRVKNEPDCQNAKSRKVTIKRASSFFGCIGVYQIICDRQVIASIRNGKTEVFEIDEKSHTIQCCSIAGENTMVSDVVNIPSGTQSADLFVKLGFASLRLKLVRLY